jgi:hypothetical protein
MIHRGHQLLSFFEADFLNDGWTMTCGVRLTVLKFLAVLLRFEGLPRLDRNNYL